MSPQAMRKVLVIEDDIGVQRALQRLLKNHTVLMTAQVEEAIILLQGDITFDMVITDYNLAGQLTGGDLIHWLQSNKPEMLEKTLVFSGNPDAAAIHTRFIGKPDLVELRAAITQIAA